MFFKKAYNAGQIFQNLHFRQNFICESNAENSTQAEISSLDCKNTQTRRFESTLWVWIWNPANEFQSALRWVGLCERVHFA